MNCRNCGYPLWNLPARACPECGAEFAPSQFTFVPGAVRFCCPGCDQAYYGTDASGHLMPREFACVTCGRAVAMDEMVMRPLSTTAAGGAGEDVRAVHIETSDMPWLDRERHGVVKAWFMTAGRAMTAPRRLMSAVPEATPASHALWFAVVNKAIYVAASSLPGLLLMMILAQGGPRVFTPALDVLVFGVGGFVAGLLGLLIWLPLTHVVLRCLRGTHAPASRTWQALGYSSAAGALSAVPMGCVSSAGSIWWYVSAIIMLAQAQRCSGGKASCAVILAGLVSAIPSLAVNGYPLYMGIRTSMLAGASGPPAGAPASRDPLGAALVAWADANGAWPDHAVQLLAGSMSPDDFILNGAVDEEDRVAGGPSLAAFEAAADVLPLVRSTAASLPPQVIAHRVGDWMFCYHGLKPQSRLTRRPLWVAVSAPPGGDRESLRRISQTFIVVNEHGTRFEYVLDDWQDLVRDQNRARRREGLPPLPENYGEWCEAELIGAGADQEGAGR